MAAISLLLKKSQNLKLARNVDMTTGVDDIRIGSDFFDDEVSNSDEV